MPTAIDSLYSTSLTLRLLCAKNASLVLGFFNEAFKERNQHAIGEEELELLLERHLTEHVVLDGEAPAENRARNYLNLWCGDDYCYLKALPAHTVLITENRTNFLTLPPLRGTIALQGQGYAVSRLGRAPFLKGKRILYWGDIDAHGFEILAVLRREFPQTESLMMDAQAWTTFAEFRVNGTRSQNSPEQYLPFLDPDETVLYRVVSEKVIRLEQERIPQRYVEAELSRRFMS